ncbi:MAG: hypothetical protein R2695_15245 [Acidimicrobiales bacterium]
MAAVRLYDTARAAVVPFEPGPVVSIYVCGITPYDSTHLGHANTYLTYDLLIRRLEDLGHEVRLVRNITDVDDSILPKARELGVDFLELAAAETARFHGDMEALDTRPVTAEPHATEWVDEMVALIERLEAGGHVYVVDGTVFFSVETFDSFGAVSGYDRATMIELARERGGHPDDPRQRDPLDFVLWQPSLPDEPSWPSPWGPGRPGWHIECSAMSMGILGETIDLHGGGSDLIFPHHECERAQSRSGHQHPVRAPLDARRDGRLPGHEDVEVARQPRVRQRALEDRRPPGHPPRAHGSPLPRRLGVARRRHRRCRGDPRSPAGRSRRPGRAGSRSLRRPGTSRARRRPRRPQRPRRVDRTGRRDPGRRA